MAGQQEKIRKVRVSITVRSDMAEEIEEVFRKRAMDALKKNEKLPKLANLYEEIVEEGFDRWKAKNRK